MSRVKWLAVPLALCLLIGCTADTPADEEVFLRETVTVANPQAAVDGVYVTLPEASWEPLTDALMLEHFPDILDKIEGYYGGISDPGDGLADLIILDPVDGARDEAREALRAYQEKRMREFENFDILGSFDIATGAEVIDQGDYVLLLMLPDTDSVREILDQYLPL